MKKLNNYGYMLVETLLVTIFVAGVLIFLFIQFSNLSNSYDESFTYNTVENLYALEDIKDYFESDSNLINEIESNLNQKEYITGCEFLADYSYCESLLDIENINTLIITTNSFDKDSVEVSDENFIKFIKKIQSSGTQPYRLIAKFVDSMGNETYATLRFGEIYE